MREYNLTDLEGKLYLILRGILPKRAVKWKRSRQYGYTAQCILRHDEKEKLAQLSKFMINISQIIMTELEQRAYALMPLKDRTRYEKCLSSPEPMTPDDWQFGKEFVLEWRRKMEQCE